MLKCEACGKESEDVSLVNDPYSEKIENRIIKIYLCDECLQESLNDR